MMTASRELRPPTISDSFRTAWLCCTTVPWASAVLMLVSRGDLSAFTVPPDYLSTKAANHPTQPLLSLVLDRLTTFFPPSIQPDIVNCELPHSGHSLIIFNTALTPPIAQPLAIPTLASTWRHVILATSCNVVSTINHYCLQSLFMSILAWWLQR